MKKANGRKIMDIIDEVRKEQQKVNEQKEKWIRDFLDEKQITIYELLTDYEFQSTDHYLETVDFSNLNSNDYRSVARVEYGFRKRTPEEREEFINRLGAQGICDCGHHKIVHTINFNVVTNCLEKTCSCNLYISKDRFVEKDESVDFGGWEDH